MTFGLAMAVGQSTTVPARLDIVANGAGSTLTWTRGGFVLQQAERPEGPWTEVPGPVITSPYAVPDTATPRYYQLVK